MEQSREEVEINLIEIFSLFLQNWWRILVLVFLGMAISLVVGLSRYSPKYEASAKIYINNNSTTFGLTQVSVSAGDLSASQQLVQTYTEVINTHKVLDKTGEALAEKGYEGYDYRNLNSCVSTSVAGETQLLYINAVDPDPELAKEIVNCLVDVMPEIVAEIIDGSSVKVVDYANGASLIDISLAREVAKGGLIGLVLALMLIFLYYYVLNDEVDRQDWLNASFQELPILGTVPDTENQNSSKYGYYYYSYGNENAKKPETLRERIGIFFELAMQKKKSKISSYETSKIGEDLDFAAREAYNAIRTNIRFSFHDKKQGHILGVTSSMVGDGKTYSSVNVAYSLAKDGKKVLLIGADLRKPTLLKYFEPRNEKGLSDLLCDSSVKISDTIIESGVNNNLYLMYSGKIPPNPSGLLGSESMKELAETLVSRYDYVIMDLPPVGSVIDAVAVSPYLDGMIVLVRHNTTKKKVLRDTMRQLGNTNTPIIGFIYNAFTPSLSLYLSNYRNYYYSNEKDNKKVDS